MTLKRAPAGFGTGWPPLKSPTSGRARNNPSASVPIRHVGNLGSTKRRIWCRWLVLPQPERLPLLFRRRTLVTETSPVAKHAMTPLSGIDHAFVMN